MPIIKAPPSLGSKLPQPARGIIDAIFPPQPDVTMAAPAQILTGPSKGLLEALAPLLKGSLRRGAEVAPEVLQSLSGGHPIGEAMLDDLNHMAPTDPLKIFAGERINTRPPLPTAIDAPTGFTYPRHFNEVTARDSTGQ